MMSRNFKPNPDDFIILIMGPTGTGKTHFINTLIGNAEQRRAGSLRSDTQNVTPYPVERDGHRFVFVDMPALDDIYRPDFEILRIISDWLTQKYADGTTIIVTGIIYLHRITDNRMSVSVERNLQMFGRICGNLVLRRARIVTTMWDKVRDRAVAENKEKQLKDDFWRNLLEEGAVTGRFDNTQTCAWNIVRELRGLGRGEDELLLQEELVGQRKRLNETEACKILRSRFQQLLIEQRKMLKDLADEAKLANDPALSRSLQEEYDRANAQLQKKFEVLKEINIPLYRRILLCLPSRKFRGARAHPRQPSVVLPSAVGQLLGMPAKLSKGHSTNVDPPEVTGSENIVNSGSRQVTAVIPEGQLPSTPWDLRNIRTKFPNDLTGYVTRGKHPFAAGGFADIYQGTFRFRRQSIKVAIKIIKTYSAEDQESKKMKRIRREVAVWLNLDHPNVLPLFGTTMKFGTFPAMVCPWVENGTLMSYLEEHNANLTTRDRLVLLNDVSTGLQYLHSKSVVHGDLSGSNILIYATGRACIADFGLSTLLDELGLGSTFMTSFQGRGTIRWAAPELLDLQEDDDNTAATQQSDVFSFGSIMLQILSGKVPYHYYTRDLQIIHAILQGIMPKRPTEDVITDCRWEFIGRCWSVAKSRPSGDEIVGFTKNELANGRS